MKKGYILTGSTVAETKHVEGLTQLLQNFEVELKRFSHESAKDLQGTDVVLLILSTNLFTDPVRVRHLVQAIQSQSTIIPLLLEHDFIPPSIAALFPLNLIYGVRESNQPYPLLTVHRLVQRIYNRGSEEKLLNHSRNILFASASIPRSMWTTFGEASTGSSAQLREALAGVLTQHVSNLETWTMREIRFLLTNSAQNLALLTSNAVIQQKRVIEDVYRDLRRGMVPRLEINGLLLDPVTTVTVISIDEQLTHAQVLERVALCFGGEQIAKHQLMEINPENAIEVKYRQLWQNLTSQTCIVIFTDLESAIERNGRFDSPIVDEFLRASNYGQYRCMMLAANASGKFEAFQSYDGRLPVIKEDEKDKIEPSAPKVIQHDSYTLIDLEIAVSEYYDSLRANIDSFEDVKAFDPFLNEFTHLQRAKKYEAASLLLLNSKEQISLTRMGSYHQIMRFCRSLLQHQYDPHLKSRVLGLLGRVCDVVGMYREGITSLNAALELGSTTIDTRYRLTFLVELARCYIGLSEYAEAIKYGEMVLQENSIHDTIVEAAALDGLGIAYRNIGEYDPAIRHYERALMLAQQDNDLTAEGRILGNLGNCYFYVGDYERAIEHSTKGLDIARQMKARRAQGIRLGNLALAYSATGNYREAMQYAEEALTISLDIGDKRSESINRGYVAICHHNLGNYQEAIRNHELSLAVAQEIEARSIVAYRIDAIGETYMTILEFDKAKKQYEEALAITVEIETLPQQNFIRMKMGQLLLMQGQYAEGEQFLKQVMDSPTPLVEDRAAMLLGVAQLYQGREADAKLQFETSIRSANVILSKSRLAYRARYSQALAHYGLLLIDPQNALLSQEPISEVRELFRQSVAGCHEKGAITELTIPYNLLKPKDLRSLFQEIDPILVPNQ